MVRISNFWKGFCTFLSERNTLTQVFNATLHLSISNFFLQTICLYSVCVSLITINDTCFVVLHLMQRRSDILRVTGQVEKNMHVQICMLWPYQIHFDMFIFKTYPKLTRVGSCSGQTDTFVPSLFDGYAKKDTSITSSDVCYSAASDGCFIKSK